MSPSSDEKETVLEATPSDDLLNESTARALHQRIRQQELLAELGVLALQRTSFIGMLDQTARMTAEGLDAEYCKVMEYIPAENRLLVRAGVGWGEGVVGAAPPADAPNSLNPLPASSPQGRLRSDFQNGNVCPIDSIMTKTCSFISIAILGVMQTSSVAGDCYFNNITLEPPDFARCYPQQSVSPTQTNSIGHRGRRGRLNLHTRH
jgi:hypothetical protein